MHYSCGRFRAPYRRLAPSASQKILNGAASSMQKKSIFSPNNDLSASSCRMQRKSPSKAPPNIDHHIPLDSKCSKPQQQSRRCRAWAPLLDSSSRNPSLTKVDAGDNPVKCLVKSGKFIMQQHNQATPDRQPR
ncbi:MAG: hypothetical protein ACI9SK_000287 [Zhongshania sp.]|jgi:hypothetical protein